MPLPDQDLIRPAAQAAAAPPMARARDPKLDAAARDFEGLLLGFVLKQGLNAGIDDEDDEAGNTAMLRDFAAEQTARELGRAGTLGIADMVYNQLAGHSPTPAAPPPGSQAAP